jgi:hypothetical protein
MSFFIVLILLTCRGIAAFIGEVQAIGPAEGEGPCMLRFLYAHKRDPDKTRQPRVRLTCRFLETVKYCKTKPKERGR